MKKGNISIILRKLGLMTATDYVRYHYFKFKNKAKNKEFSKNNPGVQLPPDYLMYESFQIDYDEYFTKSKETAEWLLDFFKKYISLDEIRILE